MLVPGLAVHGILYSAYIVVLTRVASGKGTLRMSEPLPQATRDCKYPSAAQIGLSLRMRVCLGEPARRSIENGDFMSSLPAATAAITRHAMYPA
jgi:hypothetical protein